MPHELSNDDIGKIYDFAGRMETILVDSSDYLAKLKFAAEVETDEDAKAGMAIVIAMTSGILSTANMLANDFSATLHDIEFPILDPNNELRDPSEIEDVIGEYFSAIGHSPYDQDTDDSLDPTWTAPDFIPEDWQ